MKRVSTDCEYTGDCPDKHAEELHKEFVQVCGDGSIKRYVNPDISTMKDIIAEAETYAGEWYHSEVILDERLRFTLKYVELRDKIVDLGADNGIYLSYESHPRITQSSKEIETFLKTVFRHAQK